MSDSQRPNPPPDPRTFEVPDLELEPVQRSARQAPPAPVPAQAPTKPATSVEQLFGSSFDFDDDDDFELVRTAPPAVQQGERSLRVAAEPAMPSAPSGRALDPTQLSIDPRELAVLADYGDPPESAPLTLAYAYRVFTRQRLLKRQLLAIALDSERAQANREATLAELSRELRPALQQITEFRERCALLTELEQRSAQRGQALTAINAQLGAEASRIDAQLTHIAGQIEAEQRIEREAQRRFDELNANAKRAESAPEIAPSSVELAKHALSQQHARIEALRQSQRQFSRKKQELRGAYQPELAARAQAVSETELEQRTALADLARAVLAAPGSVEIPEAWLERVRRVCERADQLIVRAEMQRRAISAYDVERARQGVRLACTALGIILVLCVFKLFF